MTTTMALPWLTVEPLTKDQIKALKAANDMVILHHFEQEQYVGGITAVIKSTLHGQRVEAKVEMAVNSHITNYEDGRASDNPLPDEDIAALKLRASHLLHYPHESGGVWQTLVGMLRPGDQLQLKWVRGNHNGTTRDAGLAVDHVSASVLRNRKTVGTVMIGYSVTQRNCSRMVMSEAERYRY